VAVSAALVEECKIEGVLKQVPIYFVSEALNGSKLLYSEMEKMAYVVVMAARKPRYYFTPFGTFLKIERPPAGSENGHHSWQSTLSVSICVVQSNLRCWLIS
jgi:hypothetical protein